MEIVGRIIEALDPVSGVSKAGNSWTKREYVLQTEETYPKNIFFDFFGDRVNQYPLEVGQRIKLSFDIESRKYNDRWYTSIRAWKAEAPDAAAAPAPAPAAAPAQAAAPAGAVPPPPVPEAGSNDDLPF